MEEIIREIVRKACFEAWDRGFNAPKEQDYGEIMDSLFKAKKLVNEATNDIMKLIENKELKAV